MPKFFVHRYDVVRIKVAVEATDHAEAMKKVDDHLAAHEPIRPYCAVVDEFAFADPANLPLMVQIEHAAETTGYLVDNADDEGFDGSIAYDVDHQPEKAA